MPEQTIDPQDFVSDFLRNSMESDNPLLYSVAWQIMKDGGLPLTKFAVKWAMGQAWEQLQRAYVEETRNGH